MEEVQKEIMDVGLNIAAICLFHGHLWCLVDYVSSLQIWFPEKMILDWYVLGF